MAKYKVKEFIGVFPYQDDDQYEFPKSNHQTYETEVEWENSFCPTQIAAKAMWKKYKDELMDYDEWLDQFALFTYGLCHLTGKHWLGMNSNYDDTVEFIAISIKEI